MTEKLAEIASNMIATLGYGGLALGLIVDSAGVPIPSEILIPLGGLLARQGRMDLTAVIIVGTLAQTIGAVLAYWLGAGSGLKLVKRYGKYVLFSEHELAKTQALFDKYGSWLTLAGRCMPGVRTYIGFPAGVARMHFGRFLTASFIGSLAWTIFLALLGYYVGDQMHVIDDLFHQFGIIILLLFIGGFIWYLYRQRRKRASKPTSES
jgi:membrane protein DedA with SNARE-associated domain